MKRLANTPLKWLMPAAALFALACALFAPAEAGVARRAQDGNVRGTLKQDESESEPEESVVRGHVVYDETSRPVRRARVILITEGSDRHEYAALTDGRGDFSIGGVRAGTYYAFVDVPGVLSPVGFINLEEMRASGRTPQLGAGRAYFDRIDVDGKEHVSVTVHARRGAAVSGRVAYADGDPAVNVNVMLLRRTSDGRVQRFLTGASLVALSGLRTDDRGMFRLTGLPPGEYVIGVTEAINHGAEASPVAISDDTPGMLRGMFMPQLVMTFYPSATDVKEAGVVKVGAGDERTDVDITIPERELRTVVGVVRARRTGRPVANARVNIARRDDPLAPDQLTAALYEGNDYGPNGTLTDADGRFYFFEIPDGAYTVSVKPPEEYEAGTASVNMNSNSTSAAETATANHNAGAEYHPPRRKRSYAPTRRSLEVSGGDVTEFVIEVAEGARVSGTITVEGGAAPRWGHVGVLRLPEPGRAPEELAAGASLDNGRFDIEGLPAGRFALQPNVDGGPTFYLKSITWNGRDLLREPLELAEGDTAEGVRVVYGSNPSKLNVSVRGLNGRSLKELFVTLVPADTSAWSPYSRPLFCEASGPSACTISAPPGEYRVVLTRSTTNPVAYEQEVRRLAPSAPRVALAEGETRGVELEAPDR